jgi:hypothetical protein
MEVSKTVTLPTGKFRKKMVKKEWVVAQWI